MRPLSPQDILASWERGARLGTLERALVLLASACPEASVAQLAALPIDERDHLLLELRVLTFGVQLKAVASCPSCGEWQDFSLPTTDLLAAPTSLELGPSVEVEVDGEHLVVRVPTSEDLLAARVADQSGETCLIERCVDSNPRVDEAVRRAALERLAVERPSVETLIELACAACGHGWRELFDPGEYLWAEVCAQARRLLLDVHVLASSYGWHERDVLGMSRIRRHAYRSMVGA
jgi:hypothetical protein